MSRQSLIRWLIPQLLLLTAAVAAVVIVASIAIAQQSQNDDIAVRRIASIAAWGAGVWVVTAVGMTWLAIRAQRRQRREASLLLLNAVPAALSRRPRLAGADHEEVLHDVARTFAELMDDAGKDQAQLLTIISSMSDGLVATDHQQRILLTNAAARELMAFRLEDWKDRQLWEVVPLEDVLKAVTEVSLTGQHKLVAIGPVNNRYLEVTITRLPLRPAGFIIVAHDVTETMRYEELRKEFVANVSHELRTPLTVIKGYVETLKDGALDDRARAMQYLCTVEKHTDQLTSLVDDLLSLSRLDSSAAVPSPRAVQLGKVAAKVVELMMPAAEKKGHKLLLQVADGLRPVIGNPEYLQRAVTNLVENAIKYTRENGLIKVIVREEAGWSVLDVIDNGIGIATDDIPRIFERFYRAERSRSRDMGGTGLGLSIVKHITQAHGGMVEVQSRPGEGTVFRLKFPAASQESAEADTNGAAA